MANDNTELTVNQSQDILSTGSSLEIIRRLKEICPAVEYAEWKLKIPLPHLHDGETPKFQVDIQAALQKFGITGKGVSFDGVFYRPAINIPLNILEQINTEDQATALLDALRPAIRKSLDAEAIIQGLTKILPDEQTEFGEKLNTVNRKAASYNIKDGVFGPAVYEIWFSGASAITHRNDPIIHLAWALEKELGVNIFSQRTRKTPKSRYKFNDSIGNISVCINEEGLIEILKDQQKRERMFEILGNPREETRKIWEQNQSLISKALPAPIARTFGLRPPRKSTSGTPLLTHNTTSKAQEDAHKLGSPDDSQVIDAEVTDRPTKTLDVDAVGKNKSTIALDMENDQPEPDKESKLC